MAKVTAILLNYKRPKELKLVIKDLKKYPFIDEIMICDNSKGENLMMYGRYWYAAQAKNEYIYVQDDDCIIENLSELYERFDGTKIVNGVKPERIQDYQGAHSIVGWGCFFRREWALCLEDYQSVFGKDPLFYREADRIFTMLAKVDRLTCPARVKDFSSAMASWALSLESGHMDSKAKAINRCEHIKRMRLAGVLSER